MKYVVTPDDEAILRTVHKIYSQQKKIPQALMIALALNNQAMIANEIKQCEDL